jgi:hypothetical protein
MTSYVHHYIRSLAHTSHQLLKIKHQLHTLCSTATCHFIITTTRDSSQRFYNTILQTKHRKLASLLHARRRLHLLHQKKLFERKFVLLFNIFLFFNGSAAILPSSESS